MKRHALLFALASSVALAGCATSSTNARAARQSHGGTTRTMLASFGDVHDALVAMLSRDPAFTVKDGFAIVTAEYAKGAERYTVTSYLAPGPSEDQTDVEVICQGIGPGFDGRKLEEAWLDKLPQAVRYSALAAPPDLRSPLDVGPRAEPAAKVPAVDDVRRY
jgi:hypothetical protein